MRRTVHPGGIRNRYMLRIGLSVGCSELTWPLRQKWFWVLFFSLLAVLLGAFLVVFLIVSLSPQSLVLTLIVVLVLWVTVRSYRKWVTDKSEKEVQREGQRCL